MSNEPKTAPQTPASDNASPAVKSTTDTKPSIAAVAPAPEKPTVEEKKS